MGDAVKRYKVMYQMVSRLVNEYNSLSDALAGNGYTSTKSGIYGNSIKLLCDDGSQDIHGKIWTLQDITGTVDGSLGAALLEIGDSLTYPQTAWGQLQATNIQALCNSLGFFQSGIGHPTEGFFTFNQYVKLLFYIWSNTGINDNPAITANVMFPSRVSSEISNYIGRSPCYMHMEVNTLSSLKMWLFSVNGDDPNVHDVDAYINIYENSNFDTTIYAQAPNTPSRLSFVSTVYGTYNPGYVQVTDPTNFFPLGRISFNFTANNIVSGTTYYVGLSYVIGSTSVPISTTSDGLNLLATSGTTMILVNNPSYKATFQGIINISKSGLWNMNDAFTIKVDGTNITILRGSDILLQCIDVSTIDESVANYSGKITTSSPSSHDVYLSHVQIYLV